MFNSRLSWLPTSLLCLLFTSPVLSGRLPSTTPYDPFHAIAALAPKRHEEPICCLKPLTPLEPVDDDLFLSFEDWKAKRFSESNNSEKGSIPPNDSAPTRVPDESASVQHIPVLMDTTLDASDSAPTTAGPDTSTPAHFRVPLTDRFNYASLDCSARVHTAHRDAKSASSILSSKRDRYMLSPCGAAPQFVVVELCEDIRIDTVQLANFEFFSGVFKEFTVSVAKTYVTDAEGWTVVGTYFGKNVRGVQSFHPPMYIRDFYRYIRIDFHSHYSNEYYCPISLLRVYGLTHLEQWKWDMWEEESRSKARQDSKATNTMAHADVILATEKLPEAKDEHVASPVAPSSLTPSADPRPDAQEQQTSSPSPEHVEGSFRRSTDIARLEPSTSPTASSESPITATYLPPPSPPLNSDQDSINDSHILSSNDTPTASSSVSLLSSRQTNDPGTSASASRSSSPSTITTLSSLSMTQAFPSPPPITNLPPLPSPMNVHAGGESIYRTIMNRLNALEANTTLYARYVEEQTSAMREMLRRLSEDVGRLEGIGRAQAQLYQRIINDFERHRREMDIEQRTLISQINYLAEEVVLEKRLGIAQLCLLLAVLVFLSVTRGSPGEFHAPPRRADTMRGGWGRRSLKLSGDWVSRLRSGPPPPLPLPHDNNAPTSAQPPPPPASATIPNTSTTTPTTSRYRRPPLFLTPTHRAPALRSAGIARPRTATTTTTTTHARPMRAPSPIRRSSSHGGSGGGGAPSIGPVPRSARRWARSAHLHEVRRAPPETDVFGGGGKAKGRSLPGTAVVGGSFVERNGNGTVRSAAGDVGVGVGGGGESWVDTDTDTDAEGSVGLWEIDAD